MDATNPNTLIFKLQITNFTDTTFWLDDVSLENPPVDRPDKILPYETVDLIFEGDPHLKQDINIDYDIKKQIFDTYIKYTNYRQTALFETTFSYCHRQTAGHRIPRVELFWEHYATSVGSEPIKCLSAIHNKSEVYPYNYFMGAVITMPD
ncbi:hypothetical protein [Pseudomonas farris]